MDSGNPADVAIRHHLTVIERITGHAPSTCPWRAFYEPIVRDVMQVAWSIADGNLGATLGPEPDPLLVQAVGVYERALKATQAEERELERQKRDAERRAREAARKAAGRG